MKFLLYLENYEQERKSIFLEGSCGACGADKWRRRSLRHKLTQQPYKSICVQTKISQFKWLLNHITDILWGIKSHFFPTKKSKTSFTLHSKHVLWNLQVTSQTLYEHCSAVCRAQWSPESDTHAHRIKPRPSFGIRAQISEAEFTSSSHSGCLMPNIFAISHLMSCFVYRGTNSIKQQYLK